MRTFLDSGVLLTAWKGKQDDAQAALAVMHDSRREFVTGQMVKLELLPKPTYHRNTAELGFYEVHFKMTRAKQPLNEKLVSKAFALAKKHGLSAADALNVAAAVELGAEEFVTSELPGKPLFRVSEIKVVTLHAAVSAE